ncbi:hypothetical protein C3Y87_00425 [Carbonactinospora thermoautotrophica]|nr:SUKH-3 domain-containing protein [Carbonactinospora thermoautotrophica]MCX9189909.1 hypothetical protein [Carbonactinospora thermoautotrophica]
MRFPEQVAAVLREAGWAPGRRDEERARRWGLELSAYASWDGRQHTFFAAAHDALAEFGGLAVKQSGPGAEVARSPFTLDPTRALHTAGTLAEFGRLLGTRLFPLGEEDDGTAYLAIDEGGRVFALDHAGEWYLGASIDEALVTLVTGRRPARVREDGTWAAPAEPAAEAGPAEQAESEASA